MNLRALHVLIGVQPVGHLYQYGFGPSMQTWFVADPDAHAERLSLAFRIPGDLQQRQFWESASTQRAQLRTQGGRLPPFFQNLLPEGALRTQIVQLRGCDKDDHFDLLAACGGDLPGAVEVYPAQLDAHALAQVVTRGNETVEASVTATPLEQAISISGMQPKLTLIREGKHYALPRRGLKGEHYIAKLPISTNSHLPEIEHLSMHMASIAGACVAQTELVPMSDMEANTYHDDVGQGDRFLAVKRFDRDVPTAHSGRIHAEDFAQVLSIDPVEKYTHNNANYAAMASVLTLLEDPAQAVAELWRRIVINDLIGNYDAHIKNFGLLYSSVDKPALSPAYDVVAYSAYYPGRGHALRFTSGQSKVTEITPHVLRNFANAAPVVPEATLRAVTRRTVELAVQHWPGIIMAADIPLIYKCRIITHLLTRTLTQRHKAQREQYAAQLAYTGALSD